MTDGRDPVERSEALLRAARTGRTEDTEACWRALAEYDSTALAAQLSDEDARTAFWLNVYNAAVQDDLRTDPSRYDSRIRFFVADRVTVAGHGLSLNDIEHGILRRSKSVFWLGYLPRLLPSGFERTHRVAELDPRIHFALNCGAASCPPIAAYTADELDHQLTLATESYLRTEVDYERENGIVRVPQLFLWYRGDFGGRAGTLELLRRYGALPADASPRVRYRSYDWSLELDNFLDRERTSDAQDTGGRRNAGAREPAPTDGGVDAADDSSVGAGD